MKSLRNRRADLIMLSLSGHADGTTAVDYTVNAAVGIPLLTGTENEMGVINHVLPAWDLIAGLHLAVGLLAAERHRARTGIGQRIDIALADVAYASMSALGFIAEAQLGSLRPRIGNDIFGAYGRDFLTADGRRVMVAGITQRQWRSIVNATATHVAFATLERRLGVDLNREEARYAAPREIGVILSDWFALQPAAAAAAALDHAHACWGFYQSVEEMVRQDPECSLANALFNEVLQPGVGILLSASSPLRTTAPPPRPAPQLGADTASVLIRDLVSQQELATRREHGTIPSLECT